MRAKGLRHQDLPYGDGSTLGLARTWPQAAAALPAFGADFDWEGDRPLGLPMQDLVIYEMHVRGFTQHPSSGVQAPGAVHFIPHGAFKPLAPQTLWATPVVIKLQLGRKWDGLGPCKCSRVLSASPPTCQPAPLCSAM